MLGIGIIGLGGISRKHIKEITACKDAKICAICDIDEAKLKTVGEQLDIPEQYRFLSGSALKNGHWKHRRTCGKVIYSLHNISPF